MDDRHAIDGQVHVQLETLRPRRDAQIEGRQRVLGTERATATVCEDERAGVFEKRHGARRSG